MNQSLGHFRLMKPPRNATVDTFSPCRAVCPASKAVKQAHDSTCSWPLDLLTILGKLSNKWYSGGHGFSRAERFREFGDSNP